VKLDATAAEALEGLRAQAEEVETVYYIYVLDRSEKLRGVFSLRQLLMAPPDRKVRDFMTASPVAVRTDAGEEEVTQAIAKYNLLALPVVDEDDRLHGIITIDDAIDLVLPLAWKKRLPRIFH
jgi:Mg/Co/Ni transporter MgtE